MRSRAPRYALLGATAAAAFSLSLWAVAHLPLRGAPFPRRQKIPSFEVPGDDAFFVYSSGDDLSQLVLFHGLGPSMEHARRAHILFIGDSRMPVGLVEDVLVPRIEGLGRRAFSLGNGHVEKIRFGLDLIRKFDLHPKIVVVVGGPHVWMQGRSERAEHVLKLSRWEAWKEWKEAEAGWAMQRLLHSYVPHIDFLGKNLVSPWIIYRSSRTGWWRPVVQPQGRYPVRFQAERASYENLLPHARELRDELEQRGALLVASIVPYGDTRFGHIEYLSRELGIPAVVPSFEGLFTCDGSHLRRDSAEEYSRRFWDQFIASAAVRRRLGLADTTAPRNERQTRPDAEPLGVTRGSGEAAAAGSLTILKE